MHRIHVFPRCPRLSLVLADAACCLLVVAVRSGSHARARPLGSFLVDFPLVQELLWPWAAAANLITVLHPATFHPCPVGLVSGATSSPRATAHSADWRLLKLGRPGPRAEALTVSCTALPSFAHMDVPTAAAVDREARNVRCASITAWPSGRLHPSTILGNGARLAARGGAGCSCGTASAGASSQTAGGGGFRREKGGSAPLEEE